MSRTAVLAMGAALLAAVSFPATSYAGDHHHGHDGGGHHRDHGNFNFSFGINPGYGYYDNGYYDDYYYDEPQQICGWVWRHHHKRWICWWE